MKILAIEPYYGGSHKAFIDGWAQRSKHDWTILTLPANKWKWRMRHSAITLSREAEDLVRNGARFDLVFCSDMLNLAEFMGLAPQQLKQLPIIAYFHENQLSYPVIYESEFDYHFAFSNMTTALTADRVWFNSEYNRDSFLEELEKFLKRMPDYLPLNEIETIRNKSSIRYPCIDQIECPKRENTSPHILWAARWEYDKNPELFFSALAPLYKQNIDFRISVIGGSGGRDPLPVFAEAREKYSDRIEAWGYLESRAEYEDVLKKADICVSTADHEFFGIGIVEALSAGVYPLVPRKLAYPEVLKTPDGTTVPDFFYDGSKADLTANLEKLITRHQKNDLWADSRSAWTSISHRYLWNNNIPSWDNEVESLSIDHSIE